MRAYGNVNDTHLCVSYDWIHRSSGNGALLDLKENGGNTTKGFVLPRVELTNLNNLFPMFTSGSPEYSGANTTQQDLVRTGLMGYHIEKCSLHGKGIYMWDGTK